MNVLMGVIFLADFIYLFAFIHKVRLCRRAPGSGLNVRLSVPGRDRSIPAQDKKTRHQDPPFCPPPTPPSLPNPSMLPWGLDGRTRVGKEGRRLSWFTGMFLGAFLHWREKFSSDLEIPKWADDQLGNGWGHHRPFLWWPHDPCALLPLRGQFLQAHWGSRQQGESCTLCMDNLLPTPAGNRAWKGERSPERNVWGRWKLPVTSESPS